MSSRSKNCRLLHEREGPEFPIVGHAVGEKLLIRIGGEICQREDSNGPYWMGPQEVPAHHVIVSVPS